MTVCCSIVRLWQMLTLTLMVGPAATGVVLGQLGASERSRTPILETIHTHKGLVSAFSNDFDAAYAALAATGGVLTVDGDCTADADCIVDSAVTVRFLAGSTLSVEVGHTVTFSDASQIHTTAEVQDCFDGPGAVAFKRTGRINVTWWGAVPDGSTDISKALSAAKTAAADASTIYFPPGTYRQATQQRFDKNITLEGYGAIVQMDGGGWRFQGTTNAETAITTDVHRGDPNVTVREGAETGFAAGDLVIIESYPNNADTDGPTTQKFREIHRVRETLPGQVCLDDPVILRYDVNEPGDPVVSGTAYYLDPNLARYDPISFAIRGFVLDANGPGGNLVYGEHCRGVVVEDVTHLSSTASHTPGYVWHLAACQQVAIRDCVFRLDVDNTKGPRFSGCQNVSVTRCQLFENRARPLYFYFCVDVTCNENQAYDNDGYIFTFESCYQVDCSHNHIRWVPDTMLDYETRGTSRPGIFICGVEKGTFTSNHITDCYGEGAFYIRTSVDVYPDYRRTAHNDDRMLPDRDLIVSNNIITMNMEPHLSTGAIYTKSAMDRVTISDNMIDGKDFGIYARGDINDLHICGNTIQTEYGHAIYITSDPEGIVDCNNVVIERNICRRETLTSNDATLGMIGVKIRQNGNCWINDNKLFSLNRNHNAHLLSVFGTGSYGTSVIQVLRNTAIATNVHSAQRGIYFAGFDGEPDRAGSILIADNYFDIPGPVYHASVSPFVKEDITAWPANEDNPNTWGISGKTWKTANTSPTTITDLGTPLPGQTIWVLVGDDHTTFDFTDSGLKGRAADLPVFTEQMLQFVYDGTDWYLAEGPDIQFWSRTFIDPDAVQRIQRTITLLPVTDRWAPRGIRLIRAGITTDPRSLYALALEEWTSPEAETFSLIASVATTTAMEATVEAGDMNDPDIAPGSIIKAGLPSIDINELTVWLEYVLK